MRIRLCQKHDERCFFTEKKSWQQRSQCFLPARSPELPGLCFSRLPDMPKFWGWHIPDSELMAPLLLSSHLYWFHSSWQSGWLRLFPKTFFENSLCQKFGIFKWKRVFHYAILMQDSCFRMGHFWLREECTSIVVHKALRTCVLGLSGFLVGMWKCGAEARMLSVWVLTGLQLQSNTVKYGFCREKKMIALYSTYACPINFLCAG